MTPETDAPDLTPDVAADAILAALDADAGEPSPTPASDPSVPPDVPTEQPDGAAPAEPSEPAADAQGDPPPADTPTPPTTEPEPFAFTADAKRVQVDGATVQGDTITLSRDAWQRHVQPYLADRGALARQRQSLEAKLQQKSVSEQQSAQLVEMLRGVAGQDEESVIAWALEWKDKLPMLLKDAEIAALKAQHAPLADAAHQQETALTEQQVGDWLDASLQTYLDTPAFQDVRRDQRFVARAKRQLALGLPLILGRDAQGRFTADWDRFQGILAAEAEDAREIGKQAAQLKTFEAAAKANAQPKKTIPPAVTSNGKPTGLTKQTVPTTKAEFEAQLAELATGDL